MAAGITASVQFSEIPSTVRVPGAYMEVNNSQAQTGLPQLWRVLLLIGQMLPTGTQGANVPLQITGGTAQADAAFGRGSMLAGMVAAAQKANTYTETWAIPLDDLAAGTAAVWTVTVTGNATEAVTQPFYIGGKMVDFGVTLGMTAADAATALAAAINANGDLPVTAAAAAGVVTVTARHKGQDAGAIDLRTTYYSGDTVAGGLTIAIANTTAGSGNPALTSAIVAMGDDWYTDIVQPYTDTANLGLMTTEAARRFGPTLQKGGRVFTFVAGTVGSLSALGSTLDDPNLSMPGLQNCPTPGYVITSVVGAVAAYYLAIDPARPLNTLLLPGVLAPAPADQFTWDNRNLLLQDGIATLKVNRANQVVIERMITTYKTNAAGAPDDSYLQVETMATIDYLRWTWDNWMVSKFPRAKIADDTGQPPPAGVVTPKLIAQEQVAWFVQAANAGLVYDVAAFKANQVVVRNASDPTRVDTLIPPHLVSGLQVIAGVLRFLLD
jgi:phage tail sheath gpL-like